MPEPVFALTDFATQLQNIPAKQKIAIEMRYVEEKTFEDIARVLKTSEVNVRQLLSRGLNRLKQLVREGDKP